LVEPAGAHIVAEELFRIAVLLQPARIDEDPFPQFSLKAV
jgi:hypothetical protein